uniref:Uncharacterized protein n=1 Tax=Arundo donax TaxID=35708 RepID=A0A0A8Z959_ARUDO
MLSSFLDYEKNFNYFQNKRKQSCC